MSLKFADKIWERRNCKTMDNEELDIDGPDNNGPISTKHPRWSCLSRVWRRSRFCYYLLLNSVDWMLGLQLDHNCNM